MGCLFYSEACLVTGIELSRSINRTINPCTDFYDYVCKKWEASNPIPSYLPSYGQFDRMIDQLAVDIKGILEGLSSKEENQTLEDKIGLAHKSCMQNGSKVEQMSQLIHVLKKFDIHGWPLEKSTNESNLTHWTNIYRKIRIGADLGFIFTVNVDPYFYNSTARAITLKDPRFVPSQIQLARYNEENHTAAFAYYEFIRKTVRLFSNSTSNERVNTIAEDIFNLEVQLAKVSILYFDFEVPDLNISIYDYANYSYYYDTEDPTGDAMTGSVDVTTRKTVDQEHNTRHKDNEAWLNSIGWLQLLKDIFQDISVNLTGEEEMNIFKPSYFQKAMKLINNTPAETLSNYFGWKLLYELGTIASDDMRKLNLEFNRVWKGIEEQQPHWRRCVRAINNPIDPILSYGLGNLYIKKYFNSTKKNDTEEFAVKLKEAAEIIIKNTTWMDDETRNNALKKLENMVFKMGYPSDIFNQSLVESIYEPVSTVISPNDSFIETYLKFRSINAINKLKKIHTTYNRTKEWPIEPMVVNGFHYLQDNSNVLPAVLLQFPFYAFGVPSSVKMGTLGFLIGHEINHAFDAEGSRNYYLDGNQQPWWSQQTIKNFNAPQKCVERLYTNETEETTKLKVHGERTFSENFADIKGLETSFLAHKKLLESQSEPQSLPCLPDIDADQLFFISLAYSFCEDHRTAELIDRMRRDPHSPPKIRMNVLFRNSKSFSDTFKCNEGDAMYSKSRCDI
ncbi:unnamed protein product [Ixodes persulcatus]